MFFTKNTLIIIVLLGILVNGVYSIDYSDALTKSWLFYEAQRSGKLPANQRATWRADSSLNDGKEAGNTIHNSSPKALSTIKWGTDYLIKAHPSPNLLYVQVGEGNSDHQCWERPEDMTTPRTVFKIDEQNHGSDLAAETSAAFDTAAIAFKDVDSAYSSLLLTHAKELFGFAKTHQGMYSDNIPQVQQFCTSSGFEYELLWSAAWLYRATGDDLYKEFISSAGPGGVRTMFAWDDKYVGAQILIAKLVLKGKVPNEGNWGTHKEQAQEFLCNYRRVDYILGDNPKGTSYMVGFGSNYPQKVPHRGSSIVSVKKDPSPVGCQEGFTNWFYKDQPNPNVLVGSIVGGPDKSDNYIDNRQDYKMAESSTANSPGIVGVLDKII